MLDYRHRGGSLPIMLEYFEAQGEARIDFSWRRVPESAGDAAWYALYFNNSSLEGTPSLIREDAKIDFSWSYGIPEYAIDSFGFSAQWLRTIELPKGKYRFSLEGNDGVAMYINDELFLDGWKDQSGRTYLKDYVHSGGPLAVRVVYYNAGGEGIVKLTWKEVEDVERFPDYWVGEYFNEDTLSQAPSLIRNDKSINFNWGEGSPSPEIEKDDFYALWKRTINLDAGLYRFHIVADDGARLKVGNTILIDEWRNHNGAASFVQDYRHKGGELPLILEYYEDGGEAMIGLSWREIDESKTIDVWRAEYYNNNALQGSPSVIRNDQAINFNWGSDAPVDGIHSDDFSVRWTRQLDLPKGWYAFSITADDGVRLFINRQLVIDEWHSQDGKTTITSSIDHPGGQMLVELQYYERWSDAKVRLIWKEIQD